MKHSTMQLGRVLFVGISLIVIVMSLLAGTSRAAPTDIDQQPRPSQSPDLGADQNWPPGMDKSVYLPLVFAAPAATATEWHVCPSGCPYTSTQAAVDAANDGDVIKVAAGTYTGVSARENLTQVVYLTKSITLRGGYTTSDWTTSYPITNVTTLDAQGQGRVLYITGNISPTIEGLRITGGNAWAGGGWPKGGGGELSASNVTLIGNTIVSNIADEGGGLQLETSVVTLSDNTVISNTSAREGGGLCSNSSHVTLSDNTIMSNTAEDGGGLNSYSGHVTLSDNTIMSNTSHGTGGGLEFDGGEIMLTHNTVMDNASGAWGGGLYMAGSNATVIENMIAANTTMVGGGGLHIQVSDVTFTNNVVASNTTTWDAGVGGGLEVVYSHGTFTGNTVAANTSRQGGGGLYLEGDINFDGAITLTGNTFMSNMSGSGGGLYLDSSHATLAGNTIVSNTADSGGGVSLIDDGSLLINNFVTDNRGGTGSGLSFGGSSVTRLLYTTLARNLDGSGVLVGGSSNVAFTNTILVSHTVGITVAFGNTATLEGTLWGSGAWANGVNQGGAGAIISGTINVFGDPGFVNPAGGDYHLGMGSAAVDAGVDSGLATDIDGDPRPAAFGFDLGADERPGASLQLHSSVWPVSLNPGHTLTYTLAVTEVGANAATNVWLTDALPPLQKAIDVTSSRGTCAITPDWGGPATCNLGTLTLSDTALVTLTAQVTNTLPPLLPWLMRNTAEITATEASNTAYADTILQNCHVRLNDAASDYDTVQAAVDTSVQPTDIVKIAGYCAGVTSHSGVRQVAYLSKTLSIQGGWNMAFTERNPISYPTTLDARGQGRVLYITGHISPTVEGLAITGGNAAGLGGDSSTEFNLDAGGGVYVISATVVMSRNYILSNVATAGGGLYLNFSNVALRGNSIMSNTGDRRGGGLYSYASSVALTDNVIMSNTFGGLSMIYGGAILIDNTVAANAGGGLFLRGGVYTFTGNTVTANTGIGLDLKYSPRTILTRNVFASNFAGGLDLSYSNVTLDGNVIVSNTGNSIGGLALAYGNVTLDGNVIVSNTGNFIGGVYAGYVTGVFTNNWLVANQGTWGMYVEAGSLQMLHNTFSNDGGIYITGHDNCTLWDCTHEPSQVNFINTILVNQTVGVMVTGGATATLEATLWGSGAWANDTDWAGNGSIITGTHNYWGDPAFVDPSRGDYHIGPTSAAIGKGVSAGVLTDIDQQPRPSQSPDLGADQYWPLGMDKSVYLPLAFKNR